MSGERSAMRSFASISLRTSLGGLGGSSGSPLSTLPSRVPIEPKDAEASLTYSSFSSRQRFSGADGSSRVSGAKMRYRL